jgi:hypothetical protein
MGNLIHYCCSFEKDNSSHPFRPDSQHQIEYKTKRQPQINFASPRPSYMHFAKPFESTSISISSNKKRLQFLENDSSVAVNELTGSVIYLKLVLGESLSLIINELSAYEVLPLIEVVVKLFSVTKELMCKDDVVNLMDNYVNSLEQVVGEMEQLFMKGKNYLNVEYRNDILGIICDLTEVYHFFKYNISGGKEPYIEYYWSKYQNVEGHVKEKIREIQSCVINVNKNANSVNTE